MRLGGAIIAPTPTCYHVGCNERGYLRGSPWVARILTRGAGTAGEFTECSACGALELPASALDYLPTERVEWHLAVAERLRMRPSDAQPRLVRAAMITRGEFMFYMDKHGPTIEVATSPGSPRTFRYTPLKCCLGLLVRGGENDVSESLRARNGSPDHLRCRRHEIARAS